MAGATRIIKAGGGAESGEGGFRAGALIAVVLVAGLLFTAALYAALGERSGRDLGDARAPSSTGATALGLGALAELLRETGRSVQAKAGVDGYAQYGSVVILSDLNDEGRVGRARYRLDQAEAIVAILPKWRIPRRSFGRRFAEEVRRQPSWTAQEALSRLLGDLRIDPPEITTQEGALQAPRRNPLGVAPEINNPQLIGEGGGLRPVITLAGGDILLGEAPFGGDGLPRLFILSDPDPLLNHGLDDGDNAVFAARLLDYLGGPGATIAFDDGPGAPKTPASFWAALFEPPLIAVTFAMLALFAALGMISLIRYGTRATDRPGQAAGKDALLDASAALLRQGDGDRAVIRRFFDETLRDVGTRLQAPDLTDPRRLSNWLTQVERSRRPAMSLSAIEDEVAAIAAGVRGRPRPERLTELAWRINAWREEMLRGHR